MTWWVGRAAKAIVAPLGSERSFCLQVQQGKLMSKGVRNIDF
jgi:hypothetical protein